MEQETLIDIMQNYLIMGIVLAVIGGYIVSALSGRGVLGIIAGLMIMMVVLAIACMPKPTCNSCGAELRYGENYCKVCGNYQNTGDIFGKIECKSCGKKIDKDSNVCSYCGATVVD